MSEPSKLPSDVDALARRLPRPGPTAERSHAMRRALLEAAELPRSRAPRRSWWLGLAAAAAVAAAVIALRVVDWTDPRSSQVARDRPTGATPTAEAITAAADARSGAVSDRLADGITAFDARQPVQLVQQDATITAPPGARFDVEVRDDKIVRISVHASWVVIAGAGTSATMVVAQETWIAPSIAAIPVGSSVPDERAAPAAQPRSERQPAAAASVRASDSEPAPAPRDPAPILPATEPGPGPAPPASATHEQQFRDGLRALLAGDTATAVAALDRACGTPSSSQEDVCYWAAVAWKRAGDRSRARAGFAAVLARWPQSTHAGEASVALGWLLLESGDRDAARARFAAATDAPTPRVREEARRGLAAAR